MTNLTLLYKLLNLSNDLQAAMDDATACDDTMVAAYLRQCGETVAECVGKVITNRSGTARTLVDAAIAGKAGAM